MERKILIVPLTLIAVIFALILWALESGQNIAMAQTGQGQALFEQKCKACHSIGGGRLIGPDLKGITEKRERDWLIRFTVAPDKLLNQGDPIAKQLLQEYKLPMPNLGISESEAHEVLAYIEAQSKSGLTAGTKKDGISPAPTGNPSVGRDIFTGKIGLKNGGAACISCHGIGGIGFLGGGTVSKDLTKTYSTLGAQAITAILQTAPFPMMKEIYTNQPLSDEETAHLVDFLQEASSGAAATPPAGSATILAIGAAGLVVVAGIFGLIWRGRLSGVRRPLVKGGSK